jgi:hypothetical protein
MTLTNTLLRRAIGGIGECARFMAGTSVLCFASMSCFAQLDRGSIAGIVSDPTGAAITGAKVTATNVAMGTQSGTSRPARESTPSRICLRATIPLRCRQRALRS